MADGPRWKRRKQANPKRNSVSNYSNAEANSNSDSDDEDKLHIVEEDSLDANANEPEGGPAAHNAVLPQNGAEHDTQWGEEDLGPEAEKKRRFKVKDESGSEEEGRGTPDPGVEELLQQGDTPVIYPVAPEEEGPQGTPEASVHDENGTPDAFSQLLACPYCARGYKRYASLKEHIKYRHEKSEDNFSCSLCSYTFAYRTQLERHMTAHKPGREQRVHATQSAGNRKFKCSECSKAFKYKHHLKEHLRIHSGEKPYECPNCKKRFSHSGSYSSHISSKKCVGPLPVNGRPRPGGKPPHCPSPAPSLPSSPAPPGRTLAREKPDPGKPLQELLPVTQIKAEPVEYEYKPVVLAPAANGVLNGGPALQPAQAPPTGVVQAVVLPTVGLVSPISINLGDLQSVLKVAVDGNVLRQVLESAHLNAAKETGGGATVAATPTHSVISAISLPIVDQDGTTKIIINYSLEPSPAHTAQPAPKKEAPPPKPASKVATPPVEDPTPNKAEQNKEAEPANGEKEPDKMATDPLDEEKTCTDQLDSERTCLLCDDCPGGLDALHKLKHCNPGDPNAEDAASTNGEKHDGEIALSALLADAAPGQPPLKSLLSLLKAYFALNAEPTAQELDKIANSVSLPPDVVRKWFHKMRSSGQIAVGGPPRPSPTPPPELAESDPPEGDTASPPPSTESPAEDEPPVDVEAAQAQNDSPEPPEDAPNSPLNLSSTSLVVVKSEGDEGQDGQAEPLDLSLPKPPRGEEASADDSQDGAYSEQDEPLNLTCTKKEPPPAQPTQLCGNTIYVTPSANPVSIVTTQLPTIVAITEQGGVSCLRAVTANKQTILIPQLTYTYATTTASSPQNQPLQINGLQDQRLQANSLQDERLDTSSEGLEEQNDSDSAPPRKKMKKTESGMYACDLCDKIFQKSSSLLRHKYEHTGKRPHECGICSKAFKHKHHLIEHMRLHSGEKPYQCDKCGKRFSHSGSYSQHMNHRYSYCKKEAQERQEGEGGEAGARGGGGADAHPLAQERQEPETDDRDEEEEEESEDEEEELEEEGLSEDEIQVVRVGEGEDDSEEEEEEELEQEEEGEGLEQEKEGPEQEEEGKGLEQEEGPEQEEEGEGLEQEEEELEQEEEGLEQEGEGLEQEEEGPEQEEEGLEQEEEGLEQEGEEARGQEEQQEQEVQEEATGQEGAEGEMPEDTQEVRVVEEVMETEVATETEDARDTKVATETVGSMETEEGGGGGGPVPQTEGDVGEGPGPGSQEPGGEEEG